jgi:hypothetical protein
MALVGALVFVVGACGVDVAGGETTTSAPGTSTTTSSSTTVVDPSTTTTAASETTTTTETLPQGEREFAYVKELRTDPDGSVTVVADYAQWLTGDEANQAAIEDGYIEEGDTVPNDYYIRNENTRLRELTLELDSPVVINVCYVDGECVTTEGVSVEQWVALFEGETVPELGDDFQWYGGPNLPYWLTLDGETVIAVEEQYLP